MIFLGRLEVEGGEQVAFGGDRGLVDAEQSAGGDAQEAVETRLVKMTPRSSARFVAFNASDVAMMSASRATSWSRTCWCSYSAERWTWSELGWGQVHGLNASGRRRRSGQCGDVEEQHERRHRPRDVRPPEPTAGWPAPIATGETISPGGTAVLAWPCIASAAAFGNEAETGHEGEHGDQHAASLA
jgi:hypothetical protein